MINRSREAGKQQQSKGGAGGGGATINMDSLTRKLQDVHGNQKQTKSMRTSKRGSLAKIAPEPPQNKVNGFTD